MALTQTEFIHPCLRCGACCAHYRVSFYWAERDDASGAVPAALTEPLTPHLVAMRGSNQKSPRCVALAGTVGQSASCTIYPQRPSPCHELKASWEDGQPDDRCDKARRAHGLPPLTLTDWCAANRS